jgi:ABC-type dipeptide/oligopeptide/nickel transport system permease component
MWEYLKKNYGYDASHVLYAVLVGLILHMYSMPTFWAGLIATQSWAIPKEIYDMSKQRWRFSWDNAADYMSYQTGWPVVYAAAQQPGMGWWTLGCVVIAYFGLVWTKLKT